MSSIKICDACAGEEELYELDERNFRTYYKCTNCNGTGKVFISNFTLSVPFGTSVSTISKYQEKIFKIIREAKQECNGK